MLFLVVVEREKPPPSYFGAVVEKRLDKSPSEFPEASKPDIFRRVDATPRQIEEVIFQARRR